MRINYNRLYIGNIMISDSYSVDEDSFGDSKNPRNTGYIAADGKAELLINLGKDISGPYFVPVKWVKGEHNLFKLSQAVNKHIKSEKPTLKDEERKVVLKSVVYGVGLSYVDKIRPLAPNKKGSLYFRELKELRERIKKLVLEKSGNSNANTFQSQSIESQS